MKKLILAVLMTCTTALAANAQKFALIDMEYILNNVPAYQAATSQMEEKSKQWQSEIEKLSNEAKQLYDSYQKAGQQTEAQRTNRENAIVEKEKAAAELRRKYFGQEGEMEKLRQQLVQPIMDDVYEIVKELAQRSGYAVVLDRASAQSIIFASPNIDISEQVLARMGE